MVFERLLYLGLGVGAERGAGVRVLLQERLHALPGVETVKLRQPRAITETLRERVAVDLQLRDLKGTQQQLAHTQYVIMIEIMASFTIFR